MYQTSVNPETGKALKSTPMDQYPQPQARRPKARQSVAIGTGLALVTGFTESLDDPTTPENEEHRHMWPRALLVGLGFATLFIFARAIGDTPSSHIPSEEPKQEIYWGRGEVPTELTIPTGTDAPLPPLEDEPAERVQPVSPAPTEPPTSVPLPDSL